MKKSTKILLGVLLLSSSIFANEVENKQQRCPEGTKCIGENQLKNKNIDELKTKILEKIDNRIMKMQENKNCVQSSTTIEQLKACRPKHNENERHKRHKNNNENQTR
jgi:hypothetical protein